MKTDPEERDQVGGMPLTIGDNSPEIHLCRSIKINSTTGNRCLITDGGTSVHQQILDENGVGQTNGYQGDGYAGTDDARKAIELYVAEHVDDVVISSSRSIYNAIKHDVDTRIQEIGKTLGAHLKGDTPDEFLDDVTVEKWRESRPFKWQFERVAGEADCRRSRQLQKPDLIREISDATGATGDRYGMAERDGTAWEKAHVTLTWMRDVLEAVCEAADYEPAAVREDDERELRDWIDELTQAGTTEVLERAIGIEDPGADSSWNRSTLRKIHDVVVAGRDPSEVGR